MLLQQLEEALQPALLEHRPPRLRPDAELFAVVAQDRQALAALVGPRAQEFDGLLGRAERDQIAQLLEDREHRDPRALLFGREMPGEVPVRHAGGVEVLVVDQRGAHSGGGERPGQPGLPDPLGQPQTLGRGPEALRQEPREPGDLAQLVGIGNGGQDRLIVAAGQQLQLSAPRHGPGARSVLGMVRLEPVPQDARVVERERDFRMTVPGLEHRQVGALCGFLEDRVEIPDRLVIVEREQERDLLHRPALSKSPSTSRAGLPGTSWAVRRVPAAAAARSADASAASRYT